MNYTSVYEGIEITEAYIDHTYNSLMASGGLNSGEQTTMDKFLVTESRELDEIHHDMEPSLYSTPQQSEINKKRKSGSPLKELYESLDETMGANTSILRQLIQAVETRQDELETTIEDRDERIAQLTVDKQNLEKRCQVNEGRTTRLEMVVENLREEISQINARAMSDDIVFRGVVENPAISVREVLVAFLKDDLLISATDIEKIFISKVFRNYNRAIIATINEEGKNIIWKNLRNLAGRRGISVYPHLPRELEERKRQLLPQFKTAKQQKQKAKWSGARLIINNQVTQISRDTVKNINLDTTEKAAGMKVKRAPPKSYGGSSFQGAMVKVDDQDDIIPALHAIYKDSKSARATHNIYAYRIRNGPQITLRTIMNMAPDDDY